MNVLATKSLRELLHVHAPLVLEYAAACGSPVGDLENVRLQLRPISSKRTRGLVAGQFEMSAIN